MCRPEMTRPPKWGPELSPAWLVIAVGWTGCTGRTFVQSRMPDAEAEREHAYCGVSQLNIQASLDGQDGDSTLIVP